MPGGASNGACGTDGEAGWAGPGALWAPSTFSAAALDAASVAGEPARLDIHYGTDTAASGDGFRFDQVTLTDLLEQTADAQSDVCAGTVLFSDGFESGDTSAWSAIIGAP